MADIIPAPQEIVDLVEIEASRHHEHLEKLGVRVKVMLHNDPDKPLLLHGRACEATIRKVSLRDRRLGIDAEAVLTICPSCWKTLNEDEQLGLIDHELTHISIVLDKNNRPARDKDKRIKIKIRPHDLEIGWFDECYERHGASSAEARDLKVFNNHLQQFQRTLPFDRKAV